MIGDRIGVTKTGEEWFVKELVEDFNWLRKEHSPNWRILQDKIGEDMWMKVLDNMDSDLPSADIVRQLVLTR